MVEYAINGGSGKLLSAYREEFLWAMPGGFDKRVKYLSETTFKNWEEAVSTGESNSSLCGSGGSWNGVDFGEAILSNDRSELKKIVRSALPGPISFWIIRPFTAMLITGIIFFVGYAATEVIAFIKSAEVIAFIKSLF